MKKLLFAMVAMMLLLSACNNKLAAEDGSFLNPTTWGDVAAEKTEAKAFEACAKVGLGVVWLNPDGTYACGVSGVRSDEFPSVAVTGCPTRAEANEMLKAVNENGPRLDLLVEVSAEKSAWQFNTGDPDWTYSITLPESTRFVASMHLKGEDKAKVFYGDGKTYEAWRGTFRFSGCYDAQDDMNQSNPWERILVKENFDGSVQEWANGTRTEDWTYSLLPGNFTCTLFECPTANSAGNLISNLPSSTSCPLFAGVQTQPGNDGGPFCKYSGSVVTDSVPAGFKAEYWDGSSVQYATAGNSIKTGEATFRPVK